jgi:hypothetical protein
MKHWIGAVCVATVAVAIPFTHARAACAVSDLEDRWDAYAMGADFDVAYWQRCTLYINSRGRFRSGTSCRDHLGNNSTLSSADFSLSRGCVLTGSTSYP